ncbi:MAG: hypothetical protein C0600_01640 [Ignavibacteria bacterium]|nr:MAG: hypothetical protein C0600_01640 [Ignavibacteria bacterium]
METPETDVHVYSVDNVRAQIGTAESETGVHSVRFYSEGGRPSRRKTDTVEDFFYYPSGGTIRDRELNILFYEPKLDKYHTSSR